MNVAEINPGATKENLAHFAVATIVLMIFTAWVIALQLHSSFWPPGSGVFRRLVWPVFRPLTTDPLSPNPGTVSSLLEGIIHQG